MAVQDTGPERTPVAEMRIVGPTICTHCGHFYNAPVVIRTGAEAAEHFRGTVGNGFSPAECEALGEAIAKEAEGGNLVSPAGVFSFEPGMKSYSFQPTTCVKCDYMNTNAGVAMAFTCDDCGRETAFAPDENADAPPTVTCRHCDRVHAADWTLVK